MNISCLAPWFGSNRLLAAHVGAALAGCDWVGVPFLGGGAELAHVAARTVVANDLHKQVINLANVLRHPALGPMLIRDLRRIPYHACALDHAQRHMLRVETEGFEASYVDALNYFVCCWMGRSGKAGTSAEFDGALPVRWNANGGDSAVRYRSAVEGLRDWRRVLARVNFACMDAFAFLAKCKDREGHGVYCDPPWPDASAEYRHGFGEAQQRRLAAVLACYGRARVVVRYGDHPLVRELYPPPRWRWMEFAGRTSANRAKAEVLITNDGTEVAAARAADALLLRLLGPGAPLNFPEDADAQA